MDLKFFQDLHTKEFERKESLASRAGTIIGGLTTLAGVIAFEIVSYKATDHAAGTFFWLLAVVSGLLLAASAICLIQSYRVPALKDVATAKELLDYWNGLKAAYKDGKGKLGSPETEFTDYLLTQYAELGHENVAANFTRGTRLVSSNNFLLAAFALVVLTSLVFYFNNYVVPRNAESQGVQQMFDSEDALLCIPAKDAIKEVPKPKPRPVPNPMPHPGPDAGNR